MATEKASKQEIQAIHLKDQRWAEMNEYLTQLERIEAKGAKSVEDLKLIRDVLNLVIAELWFRRAERVKSLGKEIKPESEGEPS